MKTLIALLGLTLSTASISAAEMAIHRDLPYAEPKNDRQSLDIYTGAKSQKPGPVVIWIHGGGWRQGDKSQLAVGTPEQHLLKPQAIVDRGGVFIAINYRFIPTVDLKTMTADVAKAIAWAKRHAPEYGGDPDKLIVMGHSAGAQLAALVCTDARYLQAEGLTLRDVKGCMPVDGASFYVPLQLQASDPKKTATLRKTFPEGSERDLSSVLHIAPNKDKGIPPFLVLCLADRLESNSKTQSQILVHYLHQAGVPAKLLAVNGKTHPTINADLGRPEEPITKAMLRMVDEVAR